MCHYKIMKYNPAETRTIECGPMQSGVVKRGVRHESRKRWKKGEAIARVKGLLVVCEAGTPAKAFYIEEQVRA